MLRRERAAASEMVRHYGDMWQRIKARIDALTKKYYAAVGAGQEVSPAWLYQLDRLQSLQRQMESELAEFSRYAETRVAAEQYDAVLAAQRHTAALLAASPEAGGAALAAGFNRLPRSAIASLVGFAQDESPLSQLLGQLGPEASEAIKRELISGLGLGLSPREVARRCRAALGGNLSRALTISRTETLRAYREAAHRSMEANAAVVEGWIWYSGRDSRTCAVCWAMHGTEHPLSERLDDHPNGRCVALPKTRTWAELGLEGVPESRVAGVESGSSLFAKLPAEQQLAILGPGELAAWQRGEFDLEDLVGRRHSSRWGSMRYERSAADTLAAAAGRSRPGTFKSLEDAERWAVEHIAGQVVSQPPAGDTTWGVAFGTDEQRLEKLNAIGREWLSLQRRFPGLKESPIDTLYNTQTRSSRALIGDHAMIVAPDELALGDQIIMKTLEEAEGRLYSRARPETWRADGFRHELGHTLATQERLSEWVAIYQKYGREWMGGNVSEYAFARGYPLLDSIRESLAECFLEVTRYGYKRGTFPEDIETFILGLLE